MQILHRQRERIRGARKDKFDKMSKFMEYPGLDIQVKADIVEIAYGGRIAAIDRSVWPPAWNIDALDPDVVRAIVNWFRATEHAPRAIVAPIEIVLQLVLSYLNIDPVPDHAARRSDVDAR